MTTGLPKPEHTDHSSRPTLSRQNKHQLAMLIANLIETHLMAHGAFDVKVDTDPADQVHSSSNCFNNVSIKEDCHAHRRSTVD